MTNSIAMNGGEGPNSYFRNSNFQKDGSAGVKALLVEGIQGTLDVEKCSQVFTIADLGCSVGPNTFSSVKTIIEAVQQTYQAHGPDGKIPEFQVFFNDNVANDFNTLFKALPYDREYTVAGVPGSFRGRLFPKSSMNLMHSAFSVHWLSRIPEEVTREDSPAWNKGRITYARSSNAVVDAFRSEFSSELKDFLDARSEELAPGGLLVMIVPSPSGTVQPEATCIPIYEYLGDALADMVKEGLISEGLADSFNLPKYEPKASEVKEVVASNKHFSIERFQILHLPLGLRTPEHILTVKAQVRAVLEPFICEHFGPKIVDDLFDRYGEKLENFSKTLDYSHVQLEYLFLLAKRNHDS